MRHLVSELAMSMASLVKLVTFSDMKPVWKQTKHATDCAPAEGALYRTSLMSPTTSTSTCMYMHRFVHVHTHTRIYTCTHTHVRMYVCTYVCTHKTHKYIYVHKHTCICICTHTHALSHTLCLSHTHWRNLTHRKVSHGVILDHNSLIVLQLSSLLLVRVSKPLSRRVLGREYAVAALRERGQNMFQGITFFFYIEC